jgi:hypothetical protein
MQHRIMTEFHSSPWGGHSGFPVTFAKLKQYFAWKGMKAIVKQFVQSCSICQQSNPDRSKGPGLLQPLPIPDSASQVMSMDFVKGLPTSHNSNCILVVVDLFTKYGHFVPLRHPLTAQTVAHAFMDQVYRLHGLPLSIVSDRDRIFTNAMIVIAFGLNCSS